MKCSKCGNSISSSDWYCPSCGAVLAPENGFSSLQSKMIIRETNIMDVVNDAFEALTHRYEILQSNFANKQIGLIHFASEKIDDISYGTECTLYKDHDFIYIFLNIKRKSKWLELNSDFNKFKPYLDGQKSIEDIIFSDEELISNILMPSRYNLDNLHFQIDIHQIQTIEISEHTFEHLLVTAEKKKLSMFEIFEGVFFSHGLVDDMSLIAMDNRVSNVNSSYSIKVLPVLKIKYLKNQIIHTVTLEYNKQLQEYFSF